jgi:hypothetical protein
VPPWGILEGGVLDRALVHFKPQRRGALKIFIRQAGGGESYQGSRDSRDPELGRLGGRGGALRPLRASQAPPGGLKHDLEQKLYVVSN